MAFSSDGEGLACGSDDGVARLWKGSGTLLEGHTQSVEYVYFFSQWENSGMVRAGTGQSVCGSLTSKATDN